MTKRTTRITAIITSMIVGYGTAFIVHMNTTTDTSDWFAPTSNAPVLEIGTEATGKTYNPQLTIDGSELQPTAQLSE